MKRINITIPEDEHDAATKILPQGEIRTFSALVREALKSFRRKLPRLNK